MSLTGIREYKQVPAQLKDDNVLPSVSEIPSLFNSLRHPRRTRSVSMGPQSEADAYEALAYREKRRRESKSDMTGSTARRNERGGTQRSTLDYFGMTTSTNASSPKPMVALPTPASSNADLYQSLTGAEIACYTPLTPSSLANGSCSTSRRPSAERREDEKETREMFSKLEKPRVRYDVEVVTKLVVYAGIAWIATEGAPILFETIGLGVESQSG